MRLKSAETLRALMNQDHLSLGVLADFVGCSKGFISHLLAGRRTSCTPLLAERIARVLRVPVSVLFEEHKSPSAGQSVRPKASLVSA
ncbi:helix-turn-helix domain-containing protein [Paenarthrobacter nicotinovorans]|uniref:helix-turn-helix domain-containing protein n=1 Tax=Paenarthrobacter nicotinovorans TaxID=29320 RepID=UPI0037F6CBA7